MADTVILGAGIIGVSTAYYLSKYQPGNTIHLVESSPRLFASASGYAAGFLARDWFGPGVASLGALSFDEHRSLAEARDGASKWGYSRSTSLSYNSASSGMRKFGRRGEDWAQAGTSSATDASGGKGDDSDGITPSWLRRETGDSVRLIGYDGAAAQVDPPLLCRFLLDECIQRGVHLHHPAKAIAAMTDLRNELSSVRIAETDSSTETDIPCTRLIITAGAWSPRVFAELFPGSSSELAVSSLAGHSLVVRSPRWTEEVEKKGGGCHAVFATSTTGFSPEIYSRAGGEIYISGLNSSTLPLPQMATDSEISSEAIGEIKKVAVKLLGSDEAAEVDDLEIVREGLCFRPVTPYGTPIISRIDDSHLGDGITTRPEAEGGVFLAAGHGMWGISLSLGTGMVLSEMAQGKKISADVRSLVLW